MNLLNQIKDSILHLVYPHICAGCGSDILPTDSQICLKCLHDLPYTHFERHANNPIEKMFTGRIPFQKAVSLLYFHKHASLQHLIHQFKYKNNREVGFQLGVLMGHSLMNTGRFGEIEALVPLPLHESKERMRGYNQATILCNGLADAMHLPVIANAVIRPMATETQTKKTRVQRWHNIEGKFRLADGKLLQNKQILLVDDVITTGATLEACATALLEAEGLKLNIATLCCALHV